MADVVNNRDANRGKPRFKAYKDILTVVGALIVITIFYASDAFRDRLKALSDSIEAARNIYFIRAELHNANGQISDMQTTLDNVWNRLRYPLLAVKKPSLSINDQEISSARYLWPTYLRDTAALGTVKDLLDKLPSSPSDNARVAHLSLIVGLEGNLAEAGRKAAFRLGPQTPAQKQAVDTAFEQASAALEDQEKDLDSDSLDEEISRFGGDVLSRASDVQRRDEATSEHWKRICYVLYAIGWLIALVGQILGIQFEGS